MKHLDSFYEAFERDTREAFHFLETDYIFRLMGIDRNRYSSVMLYQNATTGIEIEFDPRDHRIWVMLYRLINGRLPEYLSVQDLDADITNRFDLGTLIEFKAPWLLESEVRQVISSDQDMKPVIEAKATLLHQLGHGILSGDFEDFAGLGRLKLERLKKAKRS